MILIVFRSAKTKISEKKNYNCKETEKTTEFSITAVQQRYKISFPSRYQLGKVIFYQNSAASLILFDVFRNLAAIFDLLN